MSVLTGKPAPDFTAPTVMPDNSVEENFNFKEYIKGKKAILFFYPKDFTFVCPSEIIAFNNRLNAFKERGVEIIGVSTDSAQSHIDWKNTEVNKGGIGNVQYPIVADESKEVSKAYDVLIEAQGIAYRGSFLIDAEGKVRHQVVNDLPIGRDIDEALRTVDALIFHEENGDVCPAGWNKGDEGMKANAEGVASYLAKNASNL